MLVATAILTALALGITLLIALTVQILSRLPPRRAPPPQRKRTAHPHGHILVVLGSGGHTAEMVLLLQENDASLLKSFEKRTWVFSEGDKFSGERGTSMEEMVGAGDGEVAVVPRARRVHQSLLTTPITSLKCLWACTTLLRSRGAPDVIITNGPGTGVILLFASLLLRFLSPFFSFAKGHEKTRLIYVESLARVKKLSLSGKLLRRVVDRFVVQWEGLQGEFAGNLVLDAAKGVGVGRGQRVEEVQGGSGRVRIDI